jgi:polar amino acid transport system substrate-binding protein
MKLPNFFLALCGVIFFIVPGCLLEQKKEPNTLRVGTSADFPPFASLDTQSGSIVGFDIDIITEVAHRLHKKIVIQDMPFNSLLFDLFAGQIDVVAAGMSPTAQRAKKVLFSDTYTKADPFVIITKKEQPVTSMNDLKNKTLVVNTGYTADIFLSQNYPDISLIKLKSPSDAFLALQSGSVFGYATAQSTLKTFITEKNKDKYTIFAIPGGQDVYAFALHKKNQELLTAINQALTSMHADGTIEKLMKKWELV